MSVWLFEELDLNKPEKDFKKYISLLDITFAAMASDLNFAATVFKNQPTVSFNDSYSKAIEKQIELLISLNKKLKEIKILSDLEPYIQIACNELKLIHSEMLFILATFPESMHWLGHCDIHKNVQGLLKPWFTELKILMHVLKSAFFIKSALPGEKNE